jgi:hypothetical protein
VLKKQAPPAKSGETAVWQDLTGAEEVVAGDLASLTDGGIVTVTRQP